jgi:hypothetical protein
MLFFFILGLPLRKKFKKTAVPTVGLPSASTTTDDHGAGLFTFGFTDREIHGCCCGKVSVSPRVIHVRW